MRRSFVAGIRGPRTINLIGFRVMGMGNDGFRGQGSHAHTATSETALRRRHSLHGALSLGDRSAASSTTAEPLPLSLMPDPSGTHHRRVPLFGLFAYPGERWNFAN